MRVCAYVCLKNLQQLFVGRRANGTGHLPTITRPVLCLMR